MELKEGYKNTEVGLIPDDWVVKSLGKLGDVRMCKRIFSYQTKDTGDIPFYKIGTFGKEPDAYISKEIYCEFRKKYTFPRIGSVLISAAGTIGKTIVFNGEDSYFQDSNIVWIENNNQIIPDEYLKHVFPIVKFRTEGGTIQRLYNNILRNGLFPLPPTLAEQKAIARVLSDTDALIQALEKKIAKKKLIKKGVMQKLLTPKQRWDYDRLGNIASMNSGGTPLTTNPKYYSDDIIWVSISDISDAGKYIKNSIKKISEEGLLNSSARLFKSGTVLLAMYASIGKCCIATKELTTSQAILGITTSEKLHNEFLYYYLDFKVNELVNQGQQGTQSNLNKGIVENYHIHLPKIEEQIHIAQIFTDIDIEIDQLERKSTKYKQVKQGMMQQLLTGKIRLVKPNFKANEQDLTMAAEPNEIYNNEAHGK